MRRHLHGLHGRLNRSLPANAGRLVLFVGARVGEGVSSVAASFAMLAAERAESPVWLLDLDLLTNRAFSALSKGAFLPTGESVGPPMPADLGSTPFYLLEPPTSDREGLGEPFAVHQLGTTRLMVSRFAAETLAPGQRVRIRSSPHYWRAVRQVSHWTIVDAPALADTGAALAVAPHADAAVLVVRAETTPSAEARALRDAVEAHGGRIAGVVVTGLKPDGALEHVRGECPS
jgi:hypothetical protein